MTKRKPPIDWIKIVLMVCLGGSLAFSIAANVNFMDKNRELEREIEDVKYANQIEHGIYLECETALDEGKNAIKFPPVIAPPPVLPSKIPYFTAPPVSMFVVKPNKDSP